MIRAFVRWIRRRFRRAKREPVTTVTLDGDGFVSEVEWREWHKEGND